MNLSLALDGFGLTTAVGFNAPASLAAMRAGISGVRTLAWPDPTTGEPYRCARIAFPQRWFGTKLLADLVAPAIFECLAASDEKSLAAIPLLLGVGNPSRTGGDAVGHESLLDTIANLLGSKLHKDSRVYSTDQTGCGDALIEAKQLLESGRTPAVIVAGVDSFIDRGVIEDYNRRRRILTAANSNGFLPGEAGAAVLLSLPSGNRGVRISGWGKAREDATIESTKPFRGIAMSRAVRTALNDSPLEFADVAFRVTDLSGEHYKFKEALFAAMRLGLGSSDKAPELWHPVEFLGEIGAAIVPCILAWSAHAILEDYAPGPRALCHVGNDEGDRVAFIVELSQGTGNLP